MISLDAHIISKGVFKVNFDDEKKAFACRKKLNTFFNQSIIPALELSFDQYTDANQLTKVQRLEIDIGTIDIEHVDSGWLKQKIYQQVLKQLNNVSDSEITSLTTLKAQIRAYCQFLQLGSIENSSALMAIKDFENLLMADTSILNDTEWVEIVKALSHKQSRLRFIYQHSDDFFNWFITEIQPYLNLAFKQSQDARLLNLTDLQKKQLFLLCVVQAEARASLPDLLLLIQENLLQPAFSGVADNIKFSDSLDLEEVLVIQDRTESENLENSETKTDEEYASETAEQHDAFFISAAGIILLHPFLSDFFATLKLLNNDRLFKDQQSQIKAIFLLHTLSGNNKPLEEHQALLFKVMCGLAISTPIPQKLTITQHEKKEAESLLLAVIKHWQMLKNTSADGLREAFLQRDGKLQHKSNGWHLLVEQRSIDLLLGQLPWEISIIKFPWMKQVLWVEWA